MIAASLAAHQDEGDVFRHHLVSDSNFLPKRSQPPALHQPRSMRFGPADAKTA